jgi:hypothetical protein
MDFHIFIGLRFCIRKGSKINLCTLLPLPPLSPLLPLPQLPPLKHHICRCHRCCRRYNVGKHSPAPWYWRMTCPITRTGGLILIQPHVAVCFYHCSLTASPDCWHLAENQRALSPIPKKRSSSLVHNFCFFMARSLDSEIELIWLDSKQIEANSCSGHNNLRALSLSSFWTYLGVYCIKKKV